MAFTNIVNYIKKVWKDAPSTDTPINAVNLNHMEDGIFNNATAVNQLGQNLTAEDDLRFKFSKSGNKYGYKDANGTFHPFKTAHTGTYTAASRGSALDMGEDHEYRYVNTNNVPNTNSGTYSVASNGTHDMGATNTNRYVSVNVPNSYGNYTGEKKAGRADSTFRHSVVNGGTYILLNLVWGDFEITGIWGGTVLYNTGRMDFDYGTCYSVILIKATSNEIATTSSGSHDRVAYSHIIRIA